MRKERSRQSIPTLAPISPALAAAFATLPDPRKARGKRFPPVAMLNLAVTAMLATHRSELTIAEWGAAQSATIIAARRFPHPVTPHQTTVPQLFRALDPVALAHALTTNHAREAGESRGSCGVAMEGKALRGRLPFALPHAAPIHLLTRYCQTTGAVLAQSEIACTGERAEAERR